MPSESDIAAIHDEKSLITILNGLIHVCHEGHDGYLQAAEGITGSRYKTVFAENAHQREQFASQLANLVIQYGGDPDDDGHAMTLFSKGWKGIQPAITGDDCSAIFAECEKSEDMAINAYERTLEKQIPKSVALIIKQQRQQILEARDRLRYLREAYELEHKT